MTKEKKLKKMKKMKNEKKVGAKNENREKHLPCVNVFVLPRLSATSYYAS